jgi:ligand-binding SRPBCC domain-containing protein
MFQHNFHRYGNRGVLTDEQGMTYEISFGKLTNMLESLQEETIIY